MIKWINFILNKFPKIISILQENEIVIKMNYNISVSHCNNVTFEL